MTWRRTGILALLLTLASPALAGMWLDDAELAALPTSGAAWDNLVGGASRNTSAPDLGDQDDPTDVYTLAKALIYARTGDPAYGAEVRDALASLVTYHPISGAAAWDWLATARSLGSYAIAADLVELKSLDPAFDAEVFRPWLSAARTAVTEGGRGSLVSCHEDRPNNYGTHCAASRIAIALYLEDADDLARAVEVFHGWVGNRSAYAGFTFGATAWQADAHAPVGVNPQGATIDGHNVDGVLPDDQRRCSNTFVWPPCSTNYAWEALQGFVTATELLHRAGYPAFEWEDRALLRAVRWLYETTFDDGRRYEARGDDQWQIWIINKRYGTQFAVNEQAGPGKMIGWTSWTHSLSGTDVPPDAYCGDGSLDPGESCDLTNLGGASCATIGFGAGPLTCASDCSFDTSRCVVDDPPDLAECPIVPRVQWICEPGYRAACVEVLE